MPGTEVAPINRLQNKKVSLLRSTALTKYN